MKFSNLAFLSLASTFVSAIPSKVTPKLEYDFSINLVLGPTMAVGNVDIYDSQLSYLSTIGGTFSATKWNVSGTVLPGGTGTYHQVANGSGPYKLEFEYLLKTNDKPPAYILAKQKGWEVNFVGRTTYVFQTGDERYSAVNTGVYIGVETSFVTNATGTFSSVDGYSIPS